MKSHALTTLERCKAALKVSGTSDDPRLEFFIDAVSDWIEARTDRKLVARHYNGASATTTFSTNVTSEDYLYLNGSEYLRDDRTGLYYLYLPQYPIVKQAQAGLPFVLQALSSRGAGQDHSADTWETALVEGTDYTVDYRNGRVTLVSGCFRSGFENYRVTCTAGYYVDENAPYVPTDLEAAAIEWIRQLYKDRKNLQSESIGTWSRTFDVQQPDPLIDHMLGQYTRLSI